MSKLREAKGNAEATVVLMAYMLNAHRWQEIVDGRIMTQSSGKKSPAEVDNLRRLREAIATISSKTIADKSLSEIAATAAAVLAEALMEATDSAIKDDGVRSTAGFFAIVFADFLSHLVDGEPHLAVSYALFEICFRFFEPTEDAAATGQWMNRMLRAYTNMVESNLEVIFDIADNCEAWLKDPAPMQFERLAELFRSFREGHREDDRQKPSQATTS